ncbi:PAS domain S-box-containing protein/diguanylate cyclase (GGDEF)-like protein [Acidovorax sp. 69]|uniref:EAL domain-containing protein n=1 Tax=Acidovorax sp. 69 TaxID=2035202 RepID=UPI000C23A247|nr:EAL domain-containing protein [Acidovorax sp. 69]PJI95443.1 PAS domain S-box-containing protein/diguanylate cyclase (GGDEF)-like protein [Acidovorax sp. 69]
MPISVLLIESDPHHAQAVVGALADPWSGWRVDVSVSLADASAYLAVHRPDIVLAAQSTMGGSAFDLLPLLDGVPAIIVVRMGAETHAAQAMRHGFDDFTVQDPSLDYLLTVPAQIEAVLERSSSLRARRAAEAMLTRQHRLLQAISRAQAMFIASSGPRAAFEALLEELMSLTQSAFGLVGQVQRADDGHPYLRVHAMTDISWDTASRERYAQHAEAGMVFDNLRSLVGAALVSGEPVISNDAHHDVRGVGTPPGHPTLRTYLGLPIHAAGELVAMVGLANRSEGYSLADVQFLQPLLNTVGQLEMARRAALARSAVETELAHTSALLAEKTQALEVTLASVSQGITNVDAEGRIRVYNRRYLELLDLPEPLLATQPKVEEVVRFQTERGDFGPGFQLIEPMARNYVAAEYAAHGGLLSMPDTYVRRTHTGRYIEVRTCTLEPGGRVRTFTDVTDYLSTLEALRLSEARWRSLTQLSSDWYWEQDAQFRFVRLDGNPHHATGVPDEMHYGLARWELPDTFVKEGQWRDHRAQLEAHQVFHDFEMQRLTREGKPVWVSISGEPIFDAEGDFTGYRGVARDITERKLAEAEIQRLAFYDELTGLPNRRLLMDRLERAVSVSTREGSRGALLFLDLDNFKGINDTMGHEWGDRLLVQVGGRVSASVRATDTVARLGGDEFVVVVQGLHAEEAEAAVEAEAVAQKVLVALNQPYQVEGCEMHSTPSIGIALFQDAHQPVQELLKRADLAMYQAKAQGRNTLCFFDPAMQAAASARSALEGDIRQGILRNEFLLHYQPVVDEAGQLLGAEALVRWNHPQRGMVSPADFIPLAEQTGLILPLGRQVLAMACSQLAQWAVHPSAASWSLAVNVSAQEFRQPDFVQDVLTVLRESGADARRLKLELTESLLLHDVEDSILKMQALRTLGVGFSLDDFGTGYSSLSYLKRLPLDQLKIDQSFVRDVLTDPNDATIACTIITLARSLGLDVVAEGVETEGQRAFLLRNGCRQFQGYLFGRPGPAELL